MEHDMSPDASQKFKKFPNKNQLKKFTTDLQHQ